MSISTHWPHGEIETLFDQTQVEAAIATMAKTIGRDLAGREVLLLCVMNGGIVFTTQLMMQLQLPLKLDYVHATRYGDRETGGSIDWLARPRESLRDKHILVVDDILDEGETLKAIVDFCSRQEPAQINTAVLVEKQHQRRRADVQVDYRGLLVPDRYVFGYGMDCEGYGRNLPGIYAFKQ